MYGSRRKVEAASKQHGWEGAIYHGSAWVAPSRQHHGPGDGVSFMANRMYLSTHIGWMVDWLAGWMEGVWLSLSSASKDRILSISDGEGGDWGYTLHSE